MSKILLLIVIVAMGVFLYWRHQRDYNKTKHDRAHLFDDCMSLLKNSSLSQQGLGFPRLKGQYNGFEVAIVLQADTLSMRKIPALWLMLTVIGKTPTQGSLDMIVRPQNTEFYSPSWDWDGTLTSPPDWPQHALIKYKHSVASIAVLNNFVPNLFGNEKIKELLVMPALLGITYLLRQAERGEYLLMRNAKFDGTLINSMEVKRILESAIEIRTGLERVVAS